MKQIKIKTINAIAKEGLKLFNERFAVSADEAQPEGIVVRSSKVDFAAFPELLAVARAGAGVNNIPGGRGLGKRNLRLQYPRRQRQCCGRAGLHLTGHLAAQCGEEYRVLSDACRDERRGDQP